MSTYNDTPNFDAFSDSNLELSNAILAFDEFIININDEHSSYHLLTTINSRIRQAHDSLENHYTYEFESMFTEHKKTKPSKAFHLFQVIAGGKTDN